MPAPAASALRQPCGRWLEAAAEATGGLPHRLSARPGLCLCESKSARVVGRPDEQPKPVLGLVLERRTSTGVPAAAPAAHTRLWKDQAHRRARVHTWFMIGACARSISASCRVGKHHLHMPLLSHSHPSQSGL